METLLLHVDLNTRASSMPGEEVAEKLKAFADAHKALPFPEGAGRFVGQKAV